MYILDFFDEDKDCSETLKELKQEYFKELEELKKDCVSCDLRRLRDKYIKILLSKNVI
jgi:protoheme ferro-lyase